MSANRFHRLPLLTAIALITFTFTAAAQAEENASTCATHSNGMVLTGACALGAIVGTLIFPGIGTAAGCAGTTAALAGWDKLGGGNSACQAKAAKDNDAASVAATGGQANGDK